MLQIRNLFITYNKDLRVLINDFNITFNSGDKVAIIGEEGNGKSTLLKWIYDEKLIDDYASYSGEKIIQNEKLSYLPQELSNKEKQLTIYEYFLNEDMFLNTSSNELISIAYKLNIDNDIFYSDKRLNELSGGELIKIEIARILISKATVLLLDEPSNDLDIDSLIFLEKTINDFDGIVIFISHDEVLLGNTANRIIHLELLNRKTKTKHTISSLPYKEYINTREDLLNKQIQQSINDKKEFNKKMDRYRRIRDSVEYNLRNVSRQDPSTAKALKDKMHTVKAMGKRFEKEKDNLTQMPDYEEAIILKFADDVYIPSGKEVINLHLDELKTPDGKVLSKDINLHIVGPKKVGIIGKNGVGKTTLLKHIYEQLKTRDDIIVAYMSQNYFDELSLKQTPIEYLAPSKTKQDITKARSYLGAMRYTSDEMEHNIERLSGGQKAKLFILKMNLDKANVLILDEPSRNFSPLSNPIIRDTLKEFKGCIIAVSHDRLFIDEVFDVVYILDDETLKLTTNIKGENDE